MPKENLQQFFLNSLEEYAELLEDIDLRDSIVIEIGIGTAQLTKQILAAPMPPQKIIGYEIDPTVCSFRDERFDLRVMDCLQEDFSYLRDGQYSLISNPPYCVLPMIRNLVDTYRFKEAIFMVSPKHLVHFSDFQVCFELDGSAFTPPSKGKHLVMRKI